MSGRTLCERCGAPYLARLVGHRCPVCDLPDPAAATVRRRWDDPEDRLVGMLVAATAANALLLAALAVAAL